MQATLGCQAGARDTQKGHNRMPDTQQDPGSSNQQSAPPTRPAQLPPYTPPTVADLAYVEKGGGGQTIEKKYLESPNGAPIEQR